MSTMDRSSPQAETSRSVSAHAPAGSNGLQPRKLLEFCEFTYASFNPAQVTLDTHVDLSLQQLSISSIDDQSFIKQVLYGIVRYRKFLSCFLTSFYHHNRCEGHEACICATVTALFLVPSNNAYDLSECGPLDRRH